MPPDSLLDEDESYVSSEDSDFALDDSPDQTSDHSDLEDHSDKTANKRSRPQDEADAGYDNSGDEAIIKRGEKRRKKTQAKGVREHDEGEGGLIKTRRQRAAEYVSDIWIPRCVLLTRNIRKEERQYATNNEPVTIDVDALWAQMISKPPTPESKDDRPNDADTSTNFIDKPNDSAKKKSNSTISDQSSTMIRIKRTYNFAGRIHIEEKLVPRDSAEAKLYLASQGQEAPKDSPEKRVTRKAFRSAFEPQVDLLPHRADLNLGMAARIKAGKEAQAKKLNVVEKSRMDWAGYVDKEGIKDELELAGKSKDSYMAREDFLAKSEALREEDSRRARLAGKA
ncbi:bucentaur or craniofacial development-domain-containing protein [Fusarium oxysporum f. sp. albedinis]|nr:bucentaur or craniofacial development-domain-containing protein [Fusarium oxysporum]KAI3577113.1 bucentaur or craniofacial development-domain-containing protein [Fusarium oxysporum f. sp. albedinis]